MRRLHSLIAALALLLSPQAIAQTNYPDRAIKMIVPLAAASAVDVAARIVTQKMADNMGQQFVILNQPGASGMIGAEQVARAEPDGYTIGGFNDSVMTMVPNLQSKMRWDILKDFEPVSLVATVEWGLIANNQASFKSAADLIAAAKTTPGKIDYGSGGPGSPQHLAMAMFASAAGVSLTHVPYKGATQAATERCRRPDSSRLPGSRYGCCPGAGRSAQTDRSDHREEIGAIPRRTDRFGIRSARLLLQLVVCDSCSRRHTERDHRPVERRGTQGGRRSRSTR
jgi:Tripartite tricarboxylate transporter family receptor